MESRTRNWLVATLLLPVAAAGAEGPPKRLDPLVQDLLLASDRFELLSLDPKPRQPPAEGAFHGWTVLGRTTVRDAAVREKLVRALDRGVAEHDGSAAYCFRPRHGIHSSGRNGGVDMVICFECRQIQVSPPDHVVRQGASTRLRVSVQPQPVFDRVLQDAGISLGTREP